MPHVKTHFSKLASNQGVHLTSKDSASVFFLAYTNHVALGNLIFLMLLSGISGG